MTLPWLSDEELKTLTGKAQRAAQVKKLDGLGIAYRFDGQLLIVNRAEFDHDTNNNAARSRKRKGPNLSAVS